MRDIIKKVLREELDNDTLYDIKMLVDEELIDVKKYPDSTYANIIDLEAVLPHLNYYEIKDHIIELGYNYYIDNNSGLSFFDSKTEENHNLNGPAWITSNGTKYWYIDGKSIAWQSSEGRLSINDHTAWNKYFTK